MTSGSRARGGGRGGGVVGIQPSYSTRAIDFGHYFRYLNGSSSLVKGNSRSYCCW